jgi:hypothetical protein
VCYHLPQSLAYPHVVFHSLTHAFDSDLLKNRQEFISQVTVIMEKCCLLLFEQLIGVGWGEGYQKAF